MGRRRQARETALRALYLADVSPSVGGKALAPLAEETDADEKTLEFTRKLFEGTLLLRDRLDESLQGIAKNWTLGRMAAVDRNVLRLAAYEILFCPETPVNVVLDEAIEIARKYSTEESAPFINGILDKLKDARKQA